MSETSQTETFTERLDVPSQPDGAFIGRLEIGTVSGSHSREDADVAQPGKQRGLDQRQTGRSAVARLGRSI